MGSICTGSALAIGTYAVRDLQPRAGILHALAAGISERTGLCLIVQMCSAGIFWGLAAPERVHKQVFADSTAIYKPHPSPQTGSQAPSASGTGLSVFSPLRSFLRPPGGRVCRRHPPITALGEQGYMASCLVRTFRCDRCRRRPPPGWYHRCWNFSIQFWCASAWCGYTGHTARLDAVRCR